MSISVFISCLFVAAFGFINRFRGGGFTDINFGIHRRFIIIPILFLMLSMYTEMNYILSGYLTLQYFLITLLPWGRWYTIGNAPRELSGTPDMLEKTLEELTDQLNRAYSDYVCFVARNLLCLFPSIAVSLYMLRFDLLGICIIYAILFVELYRQAWEWLTWERVPTAYAEFATGVLTGVVLLCTIALLQ